MAILTVRNLPETLYHALRLRAAAHGRSIEAEVRAILEEAVKPVTCVMLGSLLAHIGQQAALTDEEFANLEQVSDRTPAQKTP